MASIMSMSFLILAFSAATTLGIKIRSKPMLHPTIRGSHIDDMSSRDSRPGTPEVPGLTGKPSTWREELGERLLHAAEASDAMKACDSFYSFGDYTWCEKAMPAKTAFAMPGKANPYIGHEYHLRESVDLAKEVEKSKGQFLGLSYGIFTGDAWSELMSNRYFVDTILHDCFDAMKDDGPMKNDLHAGFSKEKQCMNRGCYSLPYKARRVCLGRETSEVHGRKFEPLSDGLKGRAPLSTFVKMDVEGAEWPALEQLLANPEDMAKIRTLDLEVHFNRDVERNAGEKAALEHKVEIIERLAKEFAVTGSTIDPLHRALNGREHKPACAVDRIGADCKAVFPTNGYSLDQYCISFVNRKLL